MFAKFLQGFSLLPVYHSAGRRTFVHRIHSTAFAVEKPLYLRFGRRGVRAPLSGHYLYMLSSYKKEHIRHYCTSRVTLVDFFSHVRIFSPTIPLFVVLLVLFIFLLQGCCGTLRPRMADLPSPSTRSNGTPRKRSVQEAMAAPSDRTRKLSPTPPSVALPPASTPCPAWQRDCPTTSGSSRTTRSEK